MLHIPGFGFNGLVGLSPIAVARQAIGLGLAAEEFGARFFGNGTNLGGVVKHPGKLSDQAAKNLRSSINETYSGLGQSHRVMLLEEGMDFVKVGIPPEDAQFLETRKFQVEEIARIFRVPPHMIGELSRATFNNIEHQSIEFVVHTIRPWLVRWEQVMKWKLFLPSERKSFFAEFVVDGLLRGDIKNRYAAYAIGRQNGWLSADDIREMENLNPLPDGQGQIYLVNGNMVPINQAQTPKAPDPAAMRSEKRSLNKEERALHIAERRRRIAETHKRLFVDALSRVVKREVQDVGRQVQKILQRRDAHALRDWLQEFYSEHEGFVRRNLTPVFLSYAQSVASEVADEIGIDFSMTPEFESFVEAYIDNFVTRYTGSSLNQLKKIIRENKDDLLAAIEERLAEWQDTRAEKVADREVNQSNNAVALAVYGMGGVMVKRWVTVGSSCPYCRSLNGKVVGLDSPYIRAGEHFHPEGADAPLTLSYTIKHPPIHRGCDCIIVAG